MSEEQNAKVVFVVTACYNDSKLHKRAATILWTEDLVEAVDTADAVEALDYGFDKDGIMVYVALLQGGRKYHAEHFVALSGQKVPKEKSVVVYIRERKDGKWIDRWENEELKKLFEREHDQ